MQDLLAAGYCLFSYNTPAAGRVCCWTLKNINVCVFDFMSFKWKLLNLTHQLLHL